MARARRNPTPKKKRTEPEAALPPLPVPEPVQPSWQDKAAIALLGLFSLLIFWPALVSGQGWGLYDWDQHLFYYDAPRRTLLEFGQFPFWNPWYCGGIPSFANPQFPVFSLTFLLTLPFGTAFGLKLSAALHAWLGMWGGYKLAREFRLDPIPSLLCGLLLMGSTVYTLHIAVGHTIWIPTAYFPWTLWAYMRGRTDLRYSLGMGLGLAAMTLHGQLYLVVYTALALGAWSVFDTIQRRDWRPFAVVVASGGIMGLLCAFKLIPMQEIFGSRNFGLEDKSSSTWNVLVAALLRRDQALLPAERLVGQQWDWWEYGAYVGPLPLLLAAAGVYGRRAGMITVALLAGIFLWISAGWDAGLWPIVQRMPLGAGVRVPSRFILVTVFFLGLLGAAGLQLLRDRLAARGLDRWATGLPLALVLIIALDLTLISHRPLTEAFAGVEEPTVGPAVPYEQIVGGQRYPNRTPYSTMYPYFLENRGVINCFERFASGARSIPKTMKDGQPVPQYLGEAFLLGGGSARLASFSPQRFEVEYDAPNGGVVVLNQNYYNGWRVEGGTAREFNGLTATEVPPGQGRVVFWYRTGARLLWGSLITGATLLGLAWILILRFRSQRPS